MLVNPADIADDLWEKACRREDVLREFVERFPMRLGTLGEQATPILGPLWFS